MKELLNNDGVVALIGATVAVMLHIFLMYITNQF